MLRHVTTHYDIATLRHYDTLQRYDITTPYDITTLRHYDTLLGCDITTHYDITTLRHYDTASVAETAGAPWTFYSLTRD